MTLRSAILIMLCSSVCYRAPAQQNIGVLGGIQRSIWRAPGHPLSAHNRLELGLFSAMQLHSNLALRNELAIGIGATTNLRIERVRLTTMVKYYPSAKFYALLGTELLAPLVIAEEQEGAVEAADQRLDLALFTGAGTRFSDRSEVGFRVGVGMLANVEVPVYGKARDHSASVVYGYLLKGRLPGFTKRRQCKRQVRSTPLI